MRGASSQWYALLLFGLGSATALCFDVGAAEPAAKPAETRGSKEPERGKWLPVFQRHVKDYVIRVGESEGAKATQLPEPLLRWWQPIRGGDDGAVYLWVRDGRPVAAVTFFTFKWPNGTRSIVHERHSFASEPVEAEWRGESVWKTSQPGVVFKPVARAPKPADAASARLRQMQGIAREFSAKTIDEKGSVWPLRVLNKPLYRFEGKTDGGLFAFVQGTDPEAFLLLEVRGDGPQQHWEYALARYTDLELHISDRDREVFTAPHTVGAPNQIYHSSTVLNKTSDTPDDF